MKQITVGRIGDEPIGPAKGRFGYKVLITLAAARRPMLNANRPTRNRIAMLALLLTASAAGKSYGQTSNNALPDATGFAVVELFTSEGCSSCPPADANLTWIAARAKERGLNITVLSFHVDYWNSLGWDDPFSLAEATARQREYARRFDSRRVYTPQMIVNGVEEFVGSDGKKATASLEAVLTTPASAQLTIRVNPSADLIEVAFEASGASDRAQLHVAIVQATGGAEVERGENAGRSLRHTNIVRSFQTASPTPGGRGVMRLDRPSGSESEPHSVVAYLQEPDTGRIVAAASVEL